jgi:hypothetical protein
MSDSELAVVSVDSFSAPEMQIEQRSSKSLTKPWRALAKSGAFSVFNVICRSVLKS